jgi:hydrogenase expression/formation protein HypD
MREIIDTIHLMTKRLGRTVRLMEVCGTHTVAIFRHGIRSILPEGLELISGPGCPVCVTSIEDVDRAIALSMKEDTILATFGDMMRVPGSRGNFYNARSEGADIRVVYSPQEALELAKTTPDKNIVFFATGFETTSPLVAAALHEAEARGIKNFFIYSVHKLVPPALRALLTDSEVLVDGFILPGHVSTIIGPEPYEFISSEFNKPAVITGFEPEDILQGILILLKQLSSSEATIEIQYTRAVRKGGNRKAIEMIERYFKPSEARWRGIGVIPESGLVLRDEYARYDAIKIYDIKSDSKAEPKACACGEVLRGIKKPPECPLFSKGCTPEHPVGACMVSTEGSCAAYYKYSIL